MAALYHQASLGLVPSPRPPPLCSPFPSPPEPWCLSPSSLLSLSLFLTTFLSPAFCVSRSFSTSLFFLSVFLFLPLSLCLSLCPHSRAQDEHPPLDLGRWGPLSLELARLTQSGAPPLPPQPRLCSPAPLCLRLSHMHLLASGTFHLLRPPSIFRSLCAGSVPLCLSGFISGFQYPPQGPEHPPSWLLWATEPDCRVIGPHCGQWGDLGGGHQLSPLPQDPGLGEVCRGSVGSWACQVGYRGRGGTFPSQPHQPPSAQPQFSLPSLPPPPSPSPVYTSKICTGCYHGS